MLKHLIDISSHNSSLNTQTSFFPQPDILLLKINIHQKPNNIPKITKNGDRAKNGKKAKIDHYIFFSLQT